MKLHILLLLPILAGCDLPDPYLREGNWRPTGANEQNLRLMVAQPTDLARGVGDAGSEGHTAAQAIDRLRTDRVRQLPDSGVSRLRPTDTGGGGAP